VCKRKAPEGYCAKFLPREIKALRRINHPNVCKLYNTVDDVEKFYMVMEYCQGGDLLEYINKHGYIYEDEAKKLFRQIVNAVAHCHASGVVHRDLKCENILLDENGNARICDFGFAALVQTPVVTLSTHCGSYAYAAPEILQNKPYIGAQSDVWSLGVILYAMTVGRLPYNDTDMATLMSQINQRLQPPRRLSSKCTDLLRKILVVNPAKRFRTREILDHPWLMRRSSRDSQPRASGHQLPSLQTAVPPPIPPPSRSGRPSKDRSTTRAAEHHRVTKDPVTALTEQLEKKQISGDAARASSAKSSASASGGGGASSSGGGNGCLPCLVPAA
jgi:serine/threonine protein kinase